MRKAAGDEDADSFIAALEFSAFDGVSEEYQKLIAQAQAGSFSDIMLEVGADPEAAFDIINTQAAEWAAERAAELITELDDGTRTLIRGQIADAFSNGWSSSELSDALESAYGFSEDRADLIAETEMRMAIGAGAIAGARESDFVVGKQWLLSNDEGVCDECESNADQGVIGLDEDFDSGDDTVPAHPRCRCVVVFETEDDQQ